MNGCDRCGRKLGRRSWEMRLTSLFGIPTAACLYDSRPAYQHYLRICEECAADLREFMRVDGRKGWETCGRKTVDEEEIK